MAVSLTNPISVYTPIILLALKNIFFCCIGLLSLILESIAQHKSASQSLQSLVQAEGDFCGISKSKSTKEAFMTVLADDAILFRPAPVNGKKWTTNNPDSPGLLTWEPAWAEVSQAGDLGYTTGPYEYRSARTDSTPAGYGHYVSIWKKQADHTWKLVMDVGINHTKLQQTPALLLPAEEKKIPARSVTQARKELIATEKEFASSLKKNGILKTYTSYITNQARIYRNGNYPFVSNISIQNYLSSQKGMLLSETTEAFVAQESDLGYTYGVTSYQEGKAAKQGNNYIRIWKRQPDNSWKIVLDIQTPHPSTH